MDEEKMVELEEVTDDSMETEEDNEELDYYYSDSSSGVPTGLIGFILGIVTTLIGFLIGKKIKKKKAEKEVSETADEEDYESYPEDFAENQGQKERDNKKKKH